MNLNYCTVDRPIALLPVTTQSVNLSINEQEQPLFFSYQRNHPIYHTTGIAATMPHPRFSFRYKPCNLNEVVLAWKKISEGIATQSKTHKCMSRLLVDDFVVVSSASGQPCGQRTG